MSSCDWIAAIAGIFLLSACAAATPIAYSLKDDEIFISPRTHSINVAVAVLQDQRLPDEIHWEFNQKILSDFPTSIPTTVTERIVQHLRVSAVFAGVGAVSETVDLNSSESVRKLIVQGVDAILIGNLVHYYGRTGPDHQIEGRVQLGGLRLYSLHSGKVLWEGEIDKLLKRQEKSSGSDIFYASEALRGAINQLAIQLAGISIANEVYSSVLPKKPQWRVGLLLPEDLRPDEEKDTEIRKLQGNTDYSLYSDIEGAPLVNGIAEQWAARLRAAQIFGNVLTLQGRGETSGPLRHWSEEGVDVVLMSELAHSYASVLPSRETTPFPIWSGGIGYPRLFRATAFTRIENVRLIDTRSGKVLWEGEAEYGIDRTIKGWESPEKFVQESLAETMNRLVKQLSQFVPDSNEGGPSP